MLRDSADDPSIIHVLLGVQQLEGDFFVVWPNNTQLSNLMQPVVCYLHYAIRMLSGQKFMFIKGDLGTSWHTSSVQMYTYTVCASATPRRLTHQ